MRDERLREFLEMAEPHIDRDGLVRADERVPIEVDRPILAVARHEDAGLRVIAMGQGNAGIGGGSQGCRDAGQHGEIDPGGRERLQLLSAAAEDKRIAALEPHHPLALPGVLDQQRIDLLLSAADISGRLAHAYARRVAPRQIEDRGRHQPVVQDHIGVVQRPQSLEGQQFRIAGTRPDQPHLSGRAGRRRHGGQQLLRRTLCALNIAFDEAPRRRAVDDRLEETPPPAGISQLLPRALTQRPQPRSQLADSRGDERFEALAKAARQHRRRAAAGNSDQHGIAVDDRGYDEARGFAVIDHIDGNIARIRQVRDPAVHGRT